MSSIEKISIAIPVFNEETVLPELIKRIIEVIDTLPNGPHEVVLVDDGSTDQTLAILTDAAKHDDRIKVIKLSRNFGQQPAYAAALDYVTGDAVVLMDGDLQDPPEQISRMLEKPCQFALDYFDTETVWLPSFPWKLSAVCRPKECR